MTSPISSANPPSIQELCLLQIGEYRCGVDLRQVVEISHDTQVTPAKGTSSFVAGVANMRGGIVTIIDPHTRLKLPPPKESSKRRLLIIESRGEKIGLLVDEIWSIVFVEEGQCDFNIRDIKGLEASCYHGVYREGNELTILLNLEGLLYP